ncbi:unnamed protein product [Closterium sp. NIES-53]
MGTPAAVCFAVLFMSRLDEVLRRRWSGTQPLCHVRYIDDGFTVWPERLTGKDVGESSARHKSASTRPKHSSQLLHTHTTTAATAAAAATAANDTTANDTAANDTAANDTTANDTAANDTAANCPSCAWRRCCNPHPHPHSPPCCSILFHSRSSLRSPLSLLRFLPAMQPPLPPLSIRSTSASSLLPSAPSLLPSAPPAAKPPPSRAAIGAPLIGARGSSAAVTVRASPPFPPSHRLFLGRFPPSPSPSADCRAPPSALARSAPRFKRRLLW